jgi:hypothetical protein
MKVLLPLSLICRESLVTLRNMRPPREGAPDETWTDDDWDWARFCWRNPRRQYPPQEHPFGVTADGPDQWSVGHWFPLDALGWKIEDFAERFIGPAMAELAAKIPAHGNPARLSILHGTMGAAMERYKEFCMRVVMIWPQHSRVDRPVEWPVAKLLKYDVVFWARRHEGNDGASSVLRRWDRQIPDPDAA